MTDITVIAVNKDNQTTTFEVNILEKDSASKHTVTMQDADYQTWSHVRVSPEVWVEQSFRFLLERESKESILRAFDLSVIEDYFPEYAAVMAQKLMTNDK